jgi:hypothetical protein
MFLSQLMVRFSVFVAGAERLRKDLAPSVLCNYGRVIVREGARGCLVSDWGRNRSYFTEAEYKRLYDAAQMKARILRDYEARWTDDHQFSTASTLNQYPKGW